MPSAVRGAAEVVAVGQVEDGQPVAVQERHEHHGVLAGGAQPVCGDDPGVAYAGEEPCREGAEFAGDVDVGAVEAEGVAGVADVHLRGEPHPVARFEDAVGDPHQAAYDRIGGVRDAVDDVADHRMAAGAGEPVGAGAQGRQTAGEGDALLGGGVHGETGVAREGVVGRWFQGNVAGVPADRHGGRPGTDHGGGGHGRRGNQAHLTSVRSGAGRGHLAQTGG